MPILSIKATKMYDPEVSFLSLVHRGANRLPFKILKEDTTMPSATAGIDLGSLFTKTQVVKSESDESETQEAKILGVVVMKDEGFESIKKQIQEVGFLVDNEQEMEDGTIVFKQDEEEVSDDATIIRISDHVVLITKGFSPYAMNLSFGEGDSFQTVCKAQGFYPGVRTITDILNSVVSEAVSSNPQDASVVITNVFKEAGDYAASFVRSLPSKAFKLDSIFPEASTKERPGKRELEKNEPEVKETEKEIDPKAIPPNEDPKPEIVFKGLTEEEVSSIVSTQIQKAIGGVASKIDSLLAGMQKSITDSLSPVTERIDSLSSRIEKTEEKAEDTAATISGMVIGGNPPGDQHPIAKQEPVYRGEIDTAYNPDVRIKRGAWAR